MRKLKFRLLLASFFCMIFLSAIDSWAEVGITQKRIILGQSCALKGPAQALGQGMRDGALAWFKHINAEGGIKGKIIKLITLDDGYEPEACVLNTKQLIEKDIPFFRKPRRW